MGGIRHEFCSIFPDFWFSLRLHFSSEELLGKIRLNRFILLTLNAFILAFLAQKLQ